jgi:hypothetical protein
MHARWQWRVAFLVLLISLPTFAHALEITLSDARKHALPWRARYETPLAVVRAEPNTTAEVLARVSSGKTAEIIEFVEGPEVSRSCTLTQCIARSSVWAKIKLAAPIRGRVEGFTSITHFYWDLKSESSATAPPPVTETPIPTAIPTATPTQSPSPLASPEAQEFSWKIEPLLKASLGSAYRPGIGAGSSPAEGARARLILSGGQLLLEEGELKKIVGHTLEKKGDQYHWSPPLSVLRITSLGARWVNFDQARPEPSPSASGKVEIFHSNALKESPGAVLFFSPETAKRLKGLRARVTSQVWRTTCGNSTISIQATITGVDFNSDSIPEIVIAITDSRSSGWKCAETGALFMRTKSGWKKTGEVLEDTAGVQIRID